MIVDISTILDCSIDEAVTHVKTPRLLKFVAAPLVRFVPVSPRVFPAVWSTGEYLVALRLLGVVPFGKQAIVISMPATETGFTVRDAGHSAIISTWDHLITKHGLTAITDAEGTFAADLGLTAETEITKIFQK